MRIAAVRLVLSGWVLPAQPPTGTIQGKVTEQHGLPIAGATVFVTRTFAPKQVVTAYSQSVKTARDGSFLFQNLPLGTYSYCASVPGDVYLDGCHWGEPPLDLTVAAGQTLKVGIRMIQGSKLKVRVLDPSGLVAASAATSAATATIGKAPLLPVTPAPIVILVSDGHGHFVPVHLAGGEAGALDYQLAVPLDTPLNLHVMATAIQMADSAGAALPAAAGAPPGVSGQASVTAFQTNSGDPNPKSFQFTVTGVKP